MTPYDHVFAQPDFEEKIFPEITAEAAEHGLDARNADDFLQLPATGDLIELISPAGAIESSPIAGVAALAYHGYHFWRTGKHVFDLDAETLRGIISADAPPIGMWSLQTPDEAGYVQLPHYMMWARTDQGAPEPIHGFFYATSSDLGVAGRIALLIALGVRADREGVTAIEINVTLPVFPPGHFGDLQARDEGDDFANILPGGELKGFHAVTNAGEVLKMVSRILHRLIPQEA